MRNNTNTKTNTYIKTDDNKIMNETCITWVHKIDECMEICIKQNGCILGDDIHKVCKLNNLNSYNKLNKIFNEE
jgi:hypothetical protein